MSKSNIRFIVVFTILFTTLSCTSTPKRHGSVRKVVNPSDDTLKEYAREIDGLYGKLKILSLDEIPQARYSEYRKYIGNGGTAYVIVHPSYYVFFHNYGSNKVIVERGKGDFSKNIVDMFIEDYPAKDKIIKYMKEMERRERDFLKKVASKGRLVILILPQKYPRHPEYPYRKLDEYARYLNEATGSSPSIVYVESESNNRGYLSVNTLPIFNAFLKEIGVKSLLVGGGYIDLCLKDFYEDAANLKDIETVAVIPEISVESPDYIRED